MSLTYRGQVNLDQQVEALTAKASGLALSETFPNQPRHTVREASDDLDGDSMDLEDDGVGLLDTNTKSHQHISHQPYEEAATNWLWFLTPLFIFLVAFLVRAYKIGLTNSVVWDEAHFGKFGAYYLKGEFYFDVHPPLGKILVAFSGWLAGFKGQFEFASGAEFPSDVDYKSMRLFQAAVGATVPVLAYGSMQNMALASGAWALWLVVVMTCFETLSVQLSKFILLDALLMAFIASTFFCLTQVHRLRVEQRTFTVSWYVWLALSGVSLGCVCSVKWVGLFITLTYGVYVILDLGRLHFDLRLSRTRYYAHWAVRVLTLVVIPLVVYVLSFKLHFTLLNKSGTGNGSMPSLFQANLQNTDIDLSAPRSVALGSAITIRSHGLSSNLLHSHAQTYPEGSRQRQITTYGHKDDNNVWIVYPAHSDLPFDGLPTTLLLQNGQVIRLVHNETGGNLHSHLVKAPISKSAREVSVYGDRNQYTDGNDHWVVEIVEQMQEPGDGLHPLSSNFRLRHQTLGCYLATTGLALPKWAFDQGEVVCKDAWVTRDKATWWNVELHENPALPRTSGYRAPPSRFFKDFVLLNFAMMSSNNALVPDPNKRDDLASLWWQWPTVNVGLRMCGWGSQQYRYYMLGHPVTTLISTAAVGMFVLMAISTGYRYQRQLLRMDAAQFDRFWISGALPFVAWVLNFYPFVVMGRVTYVHHYLPSLYFATVVFAFVVDRVVGTWRFKPAVYLALYGITIAVFWHFSPFVYGMIGDHNDYQYLKWGEKWHMLL